MRVCVFVETFEIFTYICAGRQLQQFIPALAIASAVMAHNKRHGNRQKNSILRQLIRSLKTHSDRQEIRSWQPCQLGSKIRRENFGSKAILDSQTRQLGLTNSADFSSRPLFPTTLTILNIHESFPEWLSKNMTRLNRKSDNLNPFEKNYAP